jgi:WD40 repeat protein
MHCVKSIKNHKKVGNTFMVGGENTMTSVIHFDANAKYEAWLLEGQGVFAGHSDAIRHVESNPDGSLMLSACADHSLRIWDMNTQRCLALFSGHTGLVVS